VPSGFATNPASTVEERRFQRRVSAQKDFGFKPLGTTTNREGREFTRAVSAAKPVRLQPLRVSARIDKLRYIHRNPVKRGLVRSPEQWQWSSYRDYLLDKTGPVKVNVGWGRDFVLRSRRAALHSKSRAVGSIVPALPECVKSGALTRSCVKVGKN
jgi:hypothetical protein